MTTLPAPGSADVLYLVDLSSYLFRAYHALPPLSNSKGETTHATYGTVTMLQKLIAERKPQLLAVAMDSKGQTFRDRLDPSYKATRPAAPPDLAQQMTRSRQIVEAYGIPIFQCEGVEADDLIASAVDRALEQGIFVVIAGADKDLMQLVGDRVVMWDTMRDKVYGAPEVEEKFGVPPNKMRDLLALMGDTSDNIPGVKSVGPKTAAELLATFGSIDGIYAGLERITKKKLREALETHQAAARLSAELVTLKRDEPVVVNRDALHFGRVDLDKLRELFTELGFTRLIAAIPAPDRNAAAPAGASGSAGRSGNVRAASNVAGNVAGNVGAQGEFGFSGSADEAAGATGSDQVAALGGAGVADPLRAAGASHDGGKAAPRISLVTDIAALRAVVDRARVAGRVSIGVETTSPEPMRGVLVGIALATDDAEGNYVPIGHRYIGVPAQLSLDDVRATLGPLLADASIRKIGHDLKFVDVALSRAGMTLAGVDFDAMIASYLVDAESSHALPNLVKRELGADLATFEQVTGKTRGAQLVFDEVECERAAAYSGGNAAYVLRLAAQMGKQLDDQRLAPLAHDVELPLASVLADMERLGVLVDFEQLGRLQKRLEGEIAALEAKTRELAGRDFNPSSPRQLEVVLFDELGLKPVKRTKTGRSTDAEVLEALALEHPLPGVLLEHRQLTKLKGTYVDALPALVSRETGRIHTRWSQAVAATGRISSNDPNLQNIPIRTELGREIRRAFVAPPGMRMVSADYSQIELRVLAHLSQDPVLIDAFRTGQDVHERTAMEIFQVPAGDVTEVMRRRAKTINFGVIYGMGELALAKRLAIPRRDAAAFIAAYFERYAGVRTFMDETLEAARRSEMVHTLLGRRRLLPNLRSSNGMLRAAAERIAQNTPIQGTAADLLKLAMIRLRLPLVPGARMVLTVHDELVFEVPESETLRAMQIAKQAMEGVFALDVPLVVDVGSGPSWGDLTFA